MFDKNDCSIVWVAPDSHGGDGTAESPFDSMNQALSIAKPGDTIALKGGVYPGSVTIELSGDVRRPIRIMAEQGADVEIRGTWFLYDTSDLILSGLTFKNIVAGALSVVGACKRNRFDNLRFYNCGTRGETSCTFFFGGAGAGCNVVEECVFEYDEVRVPPPRDPKGTAVSIGLMVAEGDAHHGAPIRDHVFRRNRFVNYDYGILLGASDAASDLNGHIVEYNTIEKCGTEGILVKCGDTTVRGNLVRGCRKNSISIGAGNGSTVEANRIVDCANGLCVNGSGHTVANNCFVRCGNQAIRVCGASSDPARAEASNLFIENNTCIDCGNPPADERPADRGEKPRVAGIRIDQGTSCIVRRNLFHGQGKPYEYTGGASLTAEKRGGASRGRHTAAGCVISDNIASGFCESMEGVAQTQVSFKELARDNFSNESGYGAGGWMLTPEAFDPALDAVDDGGEYRDVDTAGGEYRDGDTAGGEFRDGDTAGGEFRDGDTAGGEFRDGDTAGGEFRDGDTAGGEFRDGDTAGDPEPEDAEADFERFMGGFFERDAEKDE